MNSYKKKMAGTRTFPALLIALILSNAAVAAPATQEQTEQWQLDMQAQIQKQSKAKIDSRFDAGRERFKLKAEQLQSMINNGTPGMNHLVSNMCRKEIAAFCDNKIPYDESSSQCLIKNTPSLSATCKKALSSGTNNSKPTVTGMTHHDIFIPPGSVYISNSISRSLSVKLSQPTKYQNVPITGTVSWYDGGNIQSYIPAGTAVQYDGLIFAPNKMISFLPNGAVKQGVLYREANIDGYTFKSGDTIFRNDESNGWRTQ